MQKILLFFMKRFRPTRARDIKERFPILFDARAHILDVGGGVFPWNELAPTAKITILNKDRHHSLPSLPDHCRWEFIYGDGTNLPYKDASFDLVFSNSVIEHVGNSDAQQKFAKEMLRVGKRIYCQTPNKWFLVEPHLIALFIHWLPFSVLRKIVRLGSVWGLVTKPDQTEIDRCLKSIKLLTYNEMVDLFPNCTLRRETVLGLTKSFIVEKLSP
jgi:SAM-dependent methyltransferase